MSVPVAETPLAAEIKALIRQEGPISVARFMALALGHPSHGYYMTRDPLGTKGDFITAPEISQMFGEMIGLWAAHGWMTMGSPARVALAELGPGRGTLMADALRAIGKVIPAFRAALEVHLVETSPVLRQAQARNLQGIEPVWHDDVSSLPDLPLIVIANEFFDALPIHQFVHKDGRWHERLVGLDGGDLVFGLAPEASVSPGANGSNAVGSDARRSNALDGTIVEYAEAGSLIMAELGRRIVRNGGAALIIDYGHVEFNVGETLQAMAGHAFVDPLARPGEADLTSHVCFEALARIAGEYGLGVDLLATQGQFLEELGIRQMATNLKRHATPQQAEDIDHALERLTDPSPRAMGSLFKVLALSPRR
jgi:NADH dehydrogenase [ubiquinone] 1 alpha subcomplex assembly factor 7